MRKSWAALLLASMMLLPGTGVQAAGDDRTIQVDLQGQKLNLGQAPFQQNDRTFVPLRAIFEALGATVEWNDQKQQVTASKGDITLELTVDKATAYRNDVPVTLDAAPVMREDRVYVPVRFIAESFHNPVQWDEATRTVKVQASNRARLEELLQEEGEKPATFRVLEKGDMLIQSGLQKQEGASEMASEVVRAADGQFEMHATLKRSGELFKAANDYEFYLAKGRIYLAFNGFDYWQTAPLDTLPANGAWNPKSLAFADLAKYGTLEERAESDRVTLHLTTNLIPDVLDEGTSSLSLPITVTIEYDKKTHWKQSITYAIDTNMMGVKVRMNDQAVFSEYNQPLAIRLPAPAQNAVEADLSELD